METLGYIIVIFISLCLLSMFIIMIEYFRPIFLDWLLKKEYRLFSFIFLSLFSISSYFFPLLIKPSTDIFYFVFYLFVIIFSTIVFIFLFYKIRKTKHIREDLATNNIELDENKILNKETPNPHVEKSKDENIAKIQKKANVINYNSFFTSNQLSYLYNKLKKHRIIDDEYLEKDFINKFLIEQIMINMEGTSLYYLHREISKIITDKITLTHFVTFFTDHKNNNYKVDYVKQAVKNDNHKLVKNFIDIFKCFPK